VFQINSAAPVIEPFSIHPNLPALAGARADGMAIRLDCNDRKQIAGT